jgi:hypothetical protein
MLQLIGREVVQLLDDLADVQIVVVPDGYSVSYPLSRQRTRLSNLLSAPCALLGGLVRGLRGLLGGLAAGCSAARPAWPCSASTGRTPIHRIARGATVQYSSNDLSTSQSRADCISSGPMPCPPGCQSSVTPAPASRNSCARRSVFSAGTI